MATGMDEIKIYLPAELKSRVHVWTRREGFRSTGEAVRMVLRMAVQESERRRAGTGAERDVGLGAEDNGRESTRTG